MLIQRFRKSGRKANVTLEFALVAVFLLLPLLAGGADFAVIISGQAQLNTALQALDYFGWTNPASASNIADLQNIITAIDSGSVYNIPTPALTASISYGCFSLAGHRLHRPLPTRRPRVPPSKRSKPWSPIRSPPALICQSRFPA